MTETLVTISCVPPLVMKVLARTEFGFPDQLITEDFLKPPYYPDGKMLFALSLKAVPVKEWPNAAWFWKGFTTKLRFRSGLRCSRPAAKITVDGKLINPARLLYEYYFGITPPLDGRFHHRLRVRGNPNIFDMVDINPARYVIAEKHSGPKRHHGPRKPKGKVSDAISRAIGARLLDPNFQLPRSPEELRELLPELCEDISPEDLEATWRANS